jgi:hypothetical protein
VTQSNGFVMTMFNGTLDSNGIFNGTAQSGSAVGATSGQVTGSDVLFNIQWSFGHTGRYSGHLNSDGSWSGVTIDLNHPASTANWTATRG